MKCKVKRTLSALLAVILALSMLTVGASASEDRLYNDLLWYIVNEQNTVTITGCAEDAQGEVVIPDRIENLPVTGIYDFAFADHDKLTGVTIPDTVTRIGIGAFCECTSLSSVNIPDKVTYIGEEAFYNCSSLSSITVPKSVNVIGDDAWTGVADDFVLYGYTGTTAESYAKENQITFIALDEEDGKQVISEDRMFEALARAMAGAEDTVTLNAAKDGETVTSVELPLNSVSDIVEQKLALSVIAPEFTVTLDPAALSLICGEFLDIGMDSVIIQVEKLGQESLNEKQLNALGSKTVAAVIAVDIFSGPYSCHQLGGGTVTVEVPFKLEPGTSTGDYQVFYTAADGSTEPVNAVFENGSLVMRLSHLSDYVVTRDSADKPVDPDPIPPTVQFTDVKSTDWFYPYVTEAAERGLMSGTGDNQFDPYGTTTRAMFVQILYAMAGKPEVTIDNPFTDVPESQWYAKAVQWAYENGVTGGTGDHTFSPNANVTREQIAVFLYAYAGKPAVSGSLSSFADASKVSGWAKNAVIWATQNKVISGSSEGGKLYLNPQKNATRAETATMMVGFAKLMEK